MHALCSSWYLIQLGQGLARLELAGWHLIDRPSDLTGQAGAAHIQRSGDILSRIKHAEAMEGGELAGLFCRSRLNSDSNGPLLDGGLGFEDNRDGGVLF